MDAVQFINKEEEEAIGILSRNQQNHITERIAKHTDAERAEFAKQVLHFEKNYPGGIDNYVSTARKMLKEAQNEVNPFDDFIPSVPKGERVDYYSQEIVELEKIGMDQLRFTGFVLVAGGLGERLGYKGIKIGIPIDLVTRTTYLQYYIEYILAFQEKSNAPKPLPLAIMTSDDTHGLTVKLLEENNYFGMRREQVTIMKQEKVPALSDSDARIALTGDKLWIESKPHGHGDVHTLLHMNKIVDKWENEGFKWVVFFQDTNALVFRCIPAMLAVSKKNNFEVNSATVPRKPGEAVGAICQLTSPDAKTNLTLNVEYNLLDGFLKKHGGEPTDKHGNSLYPGNINTLVFSLKEYRSVLKQTQGLVAEFINPKYESAEKTKFKSSTRLESLMQDYPKLLPASAKVGFTTFDRQFVFSACKNDLKSAAQKFAQGLSPECGSSCEQAFYQLNAEILRIAGATVDKPAKDHAKTYAGITVNMGPYIVLKPSYGVTIDEIKSKLRGTVHITSRSTLILEGKVNLADVEIDGSYHLAGALSIANQEFTASGKSNFVTLEEVKIEEHTPDYLKIRAYDIRNDERILKITPRK